MESKESNIFILIKDSSFEESLILKSNNNKYNIINHLESLIEKENLYREKENAKPPTLMERKHPSYRCFAPMFKKEKTITEKEKIRYSDGRTSYRIERLY